MKELSEDQKKSMRELFEENNLSKDDVFTHKHYVIITRSGIEKIQATQNIEVQYDVIKMDRDFVVLKAIASSGDRIVETFGEAGPENCRNAYYVATAEKRALSRAVLKIVGLYKHRVFGEDENVQDDE
jgi:hypothetical protein